jgi:hypothetical protein
MRQSKGGLRHPCVCNHGLDAKYEGNTTVFTKEAASVATEAASFVPGLNILTAIT